MKIFGGEDCIEYDLPDMFRVVSVRQTSSVKEGLCLLQANVLNMYKGRYKGRPWEVVRWSVEKECKEKIGREMDQGCIK